MNQSHKENYSLCVVFPMGIEAYPFLKRVETRGRSKVGKSIFRKCFFEGTEFLVVRSGIGPERAARAVRSIEEDIRMIISVGTSGALIPGLSIGQMVVVAETVRSDDPNRVIFSDTELVEKLSAACLKTRQDHILGRLATSHRAVFKKTDREALNMLVSAVAVDMESHAMAEEAAKRGCAFAGLRVISDTVDSGPLPAKVDFKSLLISPARIRDQFAPFMRWRTFIKHFFFAINKLDPVLINFIRSI